MTPRNVPEISPDKGSTQAISSAAEKNANRFMGKYDAALPALRRLRTFPAQS
jgi:hypothetical protein